MGSGGRSVHSMHFTRPPGCAAYRHQQQPANQLSTPQQPPGRLGSLTASAARSRPGQPSQPCLGPAALHAAAPLAARPP